MAESTSDPEYFFFPAELWLRIAAYLDVESLQSLQESKVVPWDVCDEPKLGRTITLSPHTNASALHRYLVRCDALPARTLRLTGCLTAVPIQLFQSISVCTQLVELYCVNCIINPLSLFKIVSTSLPELVRLEWSLFELHTYGKRLHGAFDYRVLPKLRHMYVEVAVDFENCWLLRILLHCCIRLEHLHVHTLNKERWGLLQACWIMDDPRRMVQTFAYTSQGLSDSLETLLVLAQQRRLPLFGLRPPSAIFGNVTYHVLPSVSCTYAHLEDVIASEDLAVPEEQLTFCVECCDSAPARLTEVAERPWVGRLRLLTFVLLPSSTRACIDRSYYVSPAWASPVNRFLGACTSLTELNLSLVHFEHGADVSQMFPSKALSLLRAIALPQCGLQTTSSVHHIAASCTRLEELDVCGEYDFVRYRWKCPICFAYFTALSRESVSALQGQTRLQRLTLCSLYGPHCYRFLAECKLVCLRLYWPKRSMTCCEGRSFIAWLGSKERLRSLTLNCPQVSLSVICRELGHVGLLGLQNLCIIFAVQRSEIALKSISELTRRLPLLATVHVHYWNVGGFGRRVTWIRRWRLCFPSVGAHMQDGDFVPNAPCPPDCSMTTFIGLKRPRH